jgi:hypothetical protein
LVNRYFVNTMNELSYINTPAPRNIIVPVRSDIYVVVTYTTAFISLSIED